MSENEFLTVCNVCKAFGEGDSRQEVLRGMDFTVGKGEFCVLLGPSGSGKSTLLNIIGGIDSAEKAREALNQYAPAAGNGRRKQVFSASEMEVEEIIEILMK